MDKILISSETRAIEDILIDVDYYIDFNNQTIVIDASFGKFRKREHVLLSSLKEVEHPDLYWEQSVFGACQQLISYLRQNVEGWCTV